MKKKIIIQLKLIKKSDYQFLYELLSERKKNVNIDHKKMPTYQEHLEFIKAKPYAKWYLIMKNNNRSGTIYLTKKNEVGIFIKKQYIKMGIGTKALKLLIKKNPKPYYLANVNPENIHSINFFKKNGFTPIRLILGYKKYKI